MLYLPYYGLKEKPFQDNADPKFFWLGEGQSEAIAALRFGIEKGEGITVLTGDIGTGKTATVKYLAGFLKNNFKIANIEDSDVESMDFLHFLADSLDLPNSFDNLRSFIEYTNEIYTKTTKMMLVILDEAHRSTKSLLNDLRIMTKIERAKKPLIKIVMVGQESITELIKAQPLNDTVQKTPTIFYLRPFTENETKEYIEHRLRVAGTETHLFSSGAINKIFGYSAGIPRVINTICDHALVIGYSKNLIKINSAVINECAEDLQI